MGSGQSNLVRSIPVAADEEADYVVPSWLNQSLTPLQISMMMDLHISDGIPFPINPRSTNGDSRPKGSVKEVTMMEAAMHLHRNSIRAISDGKRRSSFSFQYDAKVPVILTIGRNVSPSYSNNGNSNNNSRTNSPRAGYLATGSSRRQQEIFQHSYLLPAGYNLTWDSAKDGSFENVYCDKPLQSSDELSNWSAGNIADTSTRINTTDKMLSGYLATVFKQIIKTFEEFAQMDANASTSAEQATVEARKKKRCAYMDLIVTLKTVPMADRIRDHVYKHFLIWEKKKSVEMVQNDCNDTECKSIEPDDISNDINSNVDEERRFQRMFENRSQTKEVTVCTLVGMTTMARSEAGGGRDDDMNSDDDGAGDNTEIKKMRGKLRLKGHEQPESINKDPIRVAKALTFRTQHQNFYMDHEEDSMGYRLEQVYGVCHEKVTQLSQQSLSVAAVNLKVPNELGPAKTTDSGGDNHGDETDNESPDCVICLCEPREFACLPCRHLTMCANCVRDLTSHGKKCPICRKRAETFMKIPISLYNPKVAAELQVAASGNASR